MVIAEQGSMLPCFPFQGLTSFGIIHIVKFSPFCHRTQVRNLKLKNAMRHNFIYKYAKKNMVMSFFLN